MPGPKLVLSTLKYGIYYVLVGILFLPVKILHRIGESGVIYEVARKPILFSDEQAEAVRDDLFEGVAEGADRILKYNDFGTTSVSRHKYRRDGLQVSKQAEKSLNTGEFIISLLLVFCGLLASVFTLLPLGRGIIREVAISPKVLAGISILSTLLGFFVLSITLVRDSIVSKLMFGNEELSKGTSTDLLAKVAWNHHVAQNPADVVQAYYLLLCAGNIGEGVRSKVLEIMVKRMDPKMSSADVRREMLPKLSKEVFEELGQN